MADYHDTMQARRAADAERQNALAYGGLIEDGRTSDSALALLLAAEAVCAELRVLSTVIDYAVGSHAAATGRL